MKYWKPVLAIGLVICCIIAIAVIADVNGNNDSQEYHYTAERVNNGTILIFNNLEYYSQGVVSINVTTSPNPVGDCISSKTTDSMMIPDTHVCNLHAFFTYNPSRKGMTAEIFGEHNNSYADKTEVTMVANYINGTSRIIHIFTI